MITSFISHTTSESPAIKTFPWNAESNGFDDFAAGGNVFVDPATLLVVLFFAVLGSLLGMGSGLVPGMHVNTLALLLLAVSTPLLGVIAFSCTGFGLRPELAPLLLSVLIIAASVTHSFVDFLPSLFLGIPDESKVLSVLPAHRLLLAGQGGPALVCAATGSLIGATVALLLAIPLQLFMLSAWGCQWAIELVCPYFLVLVAILLIASEARSRKLRTFLDARLGSVVEAAVIISAAPVPMDRVPGRISGRIIKRSMRGFQIENQFGRWKVLASAHHIGANVLIEGVWSVRRRSTLAPMLALALFLASGWLGFLAMNVQLPFSEIYPGMQQSVLFPLLTGLFGFPSLLLSLRSRPVPHQEGVGEASVSFGDGLKGTIAGFLAGWLPGISSTTGTVIASLFSRRNDSDMEEGAKRFIVMVSAVGTSSAVFSLIALATLERGRTGALLTVMQVLGLEGLDAVAMPLSADFAVLLLATLVGTVLGYFATLRLGALFARKLGGVNLLPLNITVLSFILIMVTIFNGVPGLLLLASASALGLLPPLLGIGRVHLTGSMLLPLILFYFGWRDQLLLGLGG
jgi:TctA family transporter